MKKVMVLVMVGLLAASAAFAADPNEWKSIRGSAHDLSEGGTYVDGTTWTPDENVLTGNPMSAGNGGATGIEMDRLCAWCHTPHGGGTVAPLWNRTWGGSVSSLGVYNSSTTTSQATQDLIDNNGAGYADSDVVVCLSCHDGSVTGASDKRLLNPPNGEAADADFTGTGDATNLGNTMRANAVIANGTTEYLTNDHPVAIDYEVAQAADGGSGVNGLQSLANADSYGAEFFGPSSKDLWCSSCHDVHNPGSTSWGTYPFLITSNSGSRLCFACHIK